MEGETIEVSKARIVELLKEERELMLKNRDLTSSEEYDAWSDLASKSDDELIKSYL